MISKKINFLLVPLMAVLVVSLGCSSGDDKGSDDFKRSCTLTNPDVCFNDFGRESLLGGITECNSLAFGIERSNAEVGTDRCSGTKKGTCDYRENLSGATFEIFTDDTDSVSKAETYCARIEGDWKAE